MRAFTVAIDGFDRISVTPGIAICPGVNYLPPRFEGGGLVMEVSEYRESMHGVAEFVRLEADESREGFDRFHGANLMVCMDEQEALKEECGTGLILLKANSGYVLSKPYQLGPTGISYLGLVSFSIDQSSMLMMPNLEDTCCVNVRLRTLTIIGSEIMSLPLIVEWKNETPCISDDNT